MYRLLIHKQAKKKLESLSPKDRLRITNKILELSYNPDSLTLDAKKINRRIALASKSGILAYFV